MAIQCAAEKILRIIAVKAVQTVNCGLMSRNKQHEEVQSRPSAVFDMISV